MSTRSVRVHVRRVRRTTHALGLPRYMTPGAAGMDLSADLSADVVLRPGERRLVPTGLALAIPAGYEGQVRPRSGLAHRDGLTLLNAPGTIDADYRGEVQVLLINLGRAPVRIRRGDRIAQLVVSPVATVTWQEVQELPGSARGDGGFGSTDRQNGAPQSGPAPRKAGTAPGGRDKAAPGVPERRAEGSGGHRRSAARGAREQRTAAPGV